MKIIKHGVFHQDTIKIKCLRCQCEYEINKNDIKKYNKPKKVLKCAWDDVWKDKYEYYTNCPECDYDNELEYTDYEILTTTIKENNNEEI